MYTARSSKGSLCTARIFEASLIGLPNLFLALAAFREVDSSEEEVWKKWPASFERDMLVVGLIPILILSGRYFHGVELGKKVGCLGMNRSLKLGCIGCRQPPGGPRRSNLRTHITT